MSSLLIYLLQENITVHQVSLWKGDCWWCFYFKTLLLMRLLYRKFIVDDVSILRDHDDNFSILKYHSWLACLHEHVIVEEFFFIRREDRWWFLYTKKSLLEIFPNVKTISESLFRRTYHCWWFFSTKESSLMNSLKK